MTESEYNASIGKIAPGKMKLLPAGTPRPSTVTKTKSGDVIRTPHTAYSKQPGKASTASAGTNTKSGSVIITPYTAKQPNKAGVQKPKVSAKAKSTKVTPRHRTTKKYKEGSKEVRAKMDKAAREQAKNSKKWLKEFYAKKRAKRSKLEQGGILKHNLGGKHSWLNND